ncbi:MAG: amidohydrolase [Bacteroidales bacterium]
MKLKLFLVLMATISWGCKQKTSIDMIIKNAKIYSVNEDFDVFESMVVNDGEIIALGDDEEISQKFKADKEIDLKGKSVYPGLIDPHCHFYGYGATLQEADLFETTSFNDVLSRLKEHAEKFEEGWITGMGWDQNDWEVKEFPSKEKLDEIFPDRPVLIRRIDGHAALANSAALEIAGIKGPVEVEGGEVETENGEPTGILVDNAIDLVRKNIPEPTEEQIRNSLLAAQENCFAVGLTSVHDAGLDKKIIQSIDSLQKSGELKMNIYAMLSPTKENFEEFMYKGIYRTDKLHIASIKLYADGALGSRGALLIDDYSDDPGNKGLLLSSESYLREMAELADSFGYQVNTHCIGDGANRLILNLYRDILQEKNDKRWRIEHAQIVHPDDVKLFGEYSIVPSIQTTHATSDMYWADERLGDRINSAYTFQTFLQENGWLPNGSDFPIEEINPLLGYYAGVVRKDTKGYPEGGFLPDEVLTREQALRAMTIWAAKAAFEENEIGSLEPGKKANFVVLDQDIMLAPENEIYKTKILETWIDGDQVYSSEK